jgi:hypothetical protein
MLAQARSRSLELPKSDGPQTSPNDLVPGATPPNARNSDTETKRGIIRKLPLSCAERAGAGADAARSVCLPQAGASQD